MVTELTGLVSEHPVRERLVGALMRALSEAGRPEALTVYERTRQTLAEELGAAQVWDGRLAGALAGADDQLVEGVFVEDDGRGQTRHTGGHG